MSAFSKRRTAGGSGRKRTAGQGAGDGVGSFRAKMVARMKAETSSANSNASPAGGKGSRGGKARGSGGGKQSTRDSRVGGRAGASARRNGGPGRTANHAPAHGRRRRGRDDQQDGQRDDEAGSDDEARSPRQIGRQSSNDNNEDEPTGAALARAAKRRNLRKDFLDDEDDAVDEGSDSDQANTDGDSDDGDMNADAPSEGGRQSADQQNTTLFVKGVEAGGKQGEAELRKHFARFGKVDTVVCRSSGPGNTFAFVTFGDHTAAENAIKRGRRMRGNQKPLDIRWSHTKTNAKQQQQAGSSGDDTASNVLFASGWTQDQHDQQTLEAHFEQFGPVKNVALREKRGRHFAFVTFDDTEGAKQAMEESAPLDGQNVRLEWYRTDTSVGTQSAAVSTSSARRQRNVCRYGEKCTRTNDPTHRQRFAHPHLDVDDEQGEDKADPQDVQQTDAEDGDDVDQMSDDDGDQDEDDPYEEENDDDSDTDVGDSGYEGQEDEGMESDTAASTTMRVTKPHASVFDADAYDASLCVLISDLNSSVEGKHIKAAVAPSRLAFRIKWIDDAHALAIMRSHDDQAKALRIWPQVLNVKPYRPEEWGGTAQVVKVEPTSSSRAPPPTPPSSSPPPSSSTTTTTVPSWMEKEALKGQQRIASSDRPRPVPAARAKRAFPRRSLRELFGGDAQGSSKGMITLTRTPMYQEDAASGAEDDEWDSEVLVGTCMDMCPEKEIDERVEERALGEYEREPGTVGSYEMIPKREWVLKRYARPAATKKLTADQVRPMPVLQTVMEFVTNEVLDSTRYSEATKNNFIADRLRSMRRDITCQHLNNASSIALLERMVRYHIYMDHELCQEPPSVFDPTRSKNFINECITSLMQMYDDLRSTGAAMASEHEAEIYAYLILLKMERPVRAIPNAVRNAGPVQFALQLVRAYESGNYARFFRLTLQQATFLQTCLIVRFANSVRGYALQIMNRAYRAKHGQRFAVADLERLLCFNDADHAVAFLESHGVSCVTADDDSQLYAVLGSGTVTLNDKFPRRRSKLVEYKIPRGCTAKQIIDGGRSIQGVTWASTGGYFGKRTDLGGTCDLDFAALQDSLAAERMARLQGKAGAHAILSASRTEDDETRAARAAERLLLLQQREEDARLAVLINKAALHHGQTVLRRAFAAWKLYRTLMARQREFVRQQEEAARMEVERQRKEKEAAAEAARKQAQREEAARTARRMAYEAERQAVLQQRATQMESMATAFHQLVVQQNVFHAWREQAAFERSMRHAQQFLYLIKWRKRHALARQIRLEEEHRREIEEAKRRKFVDAMSGPPLIARGARSDAVQPIRGMETESLSVRISTQSELANRSYWRTRRSLELAEQSVRPLDVAGLVLPGLQQVNPHAHVFGWKLLMCSTNMQGFAWNERTNVGATQMHDWLRFKFARGQTGWTGTQHGRSVVLSQYTVRAHDVLRMWSHPAADDQDSLDMDDDDLADVDDAADIQHDTRALHVCISYLDGTPGTMANQAPLELRDAVVGVDALLFCVDAPTSKGSWSYHWTQQRVQFDALVAALPKRARVPVVVLFDVNPFKGLFPDDLLAECDTTSDVVLALCDHIGLALGLHEADQHERITEWLVQCVNDPEEESFDDVLFLSDDSLGDSLAWLGDHSPVRPNVHARTLHDVLESSVDAHRDMLLPRAAGMSSRIPWAHMTRDRKHVLGPAHHVWLFNSVLAAVVQQQRDQVAHMPAWPATELCSTPDEYSDAVRDAHVHGRTPAQLPPHKWNSVQRMAQLQVFVEQLMLPEMQEHTTGDVLLPARDDNDPPRLDTAQLKRALEAYIHRVSNRADSHQVLSDVMAVVDAMCTPDIHDDSRQVNLELLWYRIFQELTYWRLQSVRAHGDQLLFAVDYAGADSAANQLLLAEDSVSSAADMAYEAVDDVYERQEQAAIEVWAQGLAMSELWSVATERVLRFFHESLDDVRAKDASLKSHAHVVNERRKRDRDGSGGRHGTQTDTLLDDDEQLMQQGIHTLHDSKKARLWQQIDVEDIVERRFPQEHSEDVALLKALQNERRESERYSRELRRLAATPKELSVEDVFGLERW